MKIGDTNSGRGRVLRYAPLVLWIGVIFFLSTGQASMSETSRFIRPLLNFLFPGAPEETLLIYHNYIRKMAHFTEYGVLAFLATRAFSASAVEFLRKYRFIVSLILVLTVALIDETNQSFLTSRTGSIYDVLLDFGGGLTAVVIFYLAKRK